MKNINKNKEIKKNKNGRRSFIKKVVYRAPTVLFLGSLSYPVKTKAGFGDPPEGASFIDVP